MTAPEFQATRRRLGIRQEDVARRYGVHRETVAHYEREWVRRPRWDLDDAIAWFRDMMRARTIKGRP